MEITLQEIQEKFKSLPENLQLAIMDTNADEKITTIGQMHGLNIEELGQLSLEVHMVMFGLIHPEQFEGSLKKSLNFPNEKNREIVTEVNEKILRNIRKNLISNSKDDEEDISKEKINEIPEKEEVNNEENNTETKDIEKEITNKKIMESVSFKKLSGSFQSPTIKTEYSLNNISKNNEKTGTSAGQNVKIPIGATIKAVSSKTSAVSPSFSIKEDPYRMKPE